jgi:WD40 repeat protein
LKVWDLDTPVEKRTEPSEGHPRQRSVLHGHRDVVQSVAVSPDGGTALSGSLDGTLKLWDLQTYQEIREFRGHEGKVYTVRISPDGKLALSASEDKTLRIWDIETGDLITTFSEGGILHHLAVSPDGRYLVAGGDSRQVHILRIVGVETGPPIVTADHGHIECAYCHHTFAPAEPYAGRLVECPACGERLSINRFQISTLKNEGRGE